MSSRVVMLNYMLKCIVFYSKLFPFYSSLVRMYIDSLKKLSV